MKPKYEIREADAEQAAQIAAIEKVSFALPLSSQRVVDEISHPDSFFLVATGEQVLGYVFGRYILDFAEITNIAVHPEARGNGIGSALLSKLKDACLARSLLTVQLEVREGNHPALALYKRMGFREVGRRPGYYLDTGETAILMDWMLSE